MRVILYFVLEYATILVRVVGGGGPGGRGRVAVLQLPETGENKWNAGQPIALNQVKASEQKS